MQEVKRAMEPVARLDDAGGGADPALELRDGTRCTLDRNDPRFAVWLRLINRDFASGMPVYVECEPGGRARVILPVAAQVVEEVGPEPSDGRVAVAIFMSPSEHCLSTMREGYEERRALLEEAAKTSEPLLLAVEPRSLEIVGARRPPKGLKFVVI